MPSEVVVEGHVDHAIVQAIAPTLVVPRPESPSGREAAIKRAAVAAKQLGTHRIALLLDRNGYDVPQIHGEVRKAITKVWEEEVEYKGGWYRRGGSGLRLVMAGLPDNPLLAMLGIQRFSCDDYLLLMLLRDESLGAFCEGESHLSYQPASGIALQEMLFAAVGALRQWELRFVSSKQYVLLARSIIGFDAARATLAQRLIERAPPSIVEDILGTLRKELIKDPPW